MDDIAGFAGKARKEFLGRVENHVASLKQLTTYLGNDSFSNTLYHLSCELLTQYALLEESFIDTEPRVGLSKTSEIAWRCRNLLEIDTWIRYCLSSRDRAMRFRGDTMRDVLDWLNGFRELTKLLQPEAKGVKDVLKTLETVEEHIRTKAKNTGVEGVDDAYTRIANAAQELGPQTHAAFIRTNKILSKLAHPTAFVILSFPKPTEAKLFESSLHAIVGNHLKTQFSALLP